VGDGAAASESIPCCQRGLRPRWLGAGPSADWREHPRCRRRCQHTPNLWCSRTWPCGQDTWGWDMAMWRDERPVGTPVATRVSRKRPGSSVETIRDVGAIMCFAYSSRTMPPAIFVNASVGALTCTPSVRGVSKMSTQVVQSIQSS
jgi:hypothetical protein